MVGCLTHIGVPRTLLSRLPASAQLDPAKAAQPAPPCLHLPLVSSMSDYGALPTNGVGAGMKNDAFADAVQRARQVTERLRPREEATGEGRRTGGSRLAAGTRRLAPLPSHRELPG